MSTKPPVVDVPAVPTVPEPYSRDKLLFEILQTAAMQLRQDALGIEQEDMALVSRLWSIYDAVRSISKNDPLFSAGKLPDAKASFLLNALRCE